MAIITISRGSFSKGKEVAQKVAMRLGYRSVSREVILEASKDFQIPLKKLNHAIHDAPSILERFSFEKQRYISYVAAEILNYFKDDNLVYHGLAGHFFAKNISHLLKVRIIANMEDRVAELIKKDNFSREQAIKFLENDDRERKNWSFQLYGVDTTNINLYDLVIHINRLSIDDAVDLICEAVGKPQFKATAESQQAIEDLTLAAGIRAALIDEYPSCKVIARGKSIEVSVQVSSYADTKISDVLREKVLKVPGITSVSVNLIPSSLFS